MINLEGLFKLKITNGVPDNIVLCPHCFKSSLDFIIVTTAKQNADNKNPGMGIATGLATCKFCGENCSVTGTYLIEPNSPELNGSVKDNVVVQPQSFNPPIHFIISHTQFSQDVNEELKKSFSSVYSDKDTSLNKIRKAVERSMDSFKISDTLNLHQRIEELKKKGGKYVKAGDAFMALKWLGNIATHESNQLSDLALIRAYVIIEYIGYMLFDEENVEKIIEDINKSSGEVAKTW